MPLSSTSILEYTTSNIPAFLTKLWTLVEDEKNSELIAWDPSGFSFHVFDQTRFAREILPRFVTHNNMASFIRQLNMYGFRKVNSIDHGSLRSEKEDLEFHHPYFIKDKEQFLEYIKRKVSDIRHSQGSLAAGSQMNSQGQLCASLQAQAIQQPQQLNQITLSPSSCQSNIQAIQAFPQIKPDEINKVSTWYWQFLGVRILRYGILRYVTENYVTLRKITLLSRLRYGKGFPNGEK